MTASGEAPSLLTCLETPIVVGDPDGCAVYVNPTFEAIFEVTSQGVRGTPLATLFDGGGREEVLRAVAEVCSQGRSVRFRLRARGRGFSAIASPIHAGEDRVGAILLLTDDAAGGERLLAGQRAIQEPVDELAQSLEHLLEQTGGRRAERYRGLVEDGLRALGRLRKRIEEFAAIANGRPLAMPAAASFEPVRMLRAATARAGREAGAAGIAIDMLAPPQLPAVRGDGERFEGALLQVLRDRLAQRPAPASLTVSAKAVGGGAEASVLISITEPVAEDGPGSGAEAQGPAALRELVDAVGGTLRAASDPLTGRTLLIRLPVAS